MSHDLVFQITEDKRATDQPEERTSPRQVARKSRNPITFSTLPKLWHLCSGSTGQYLNNLIFFKPRYVYSLALA